MLSSASPVKLISPRRHGDARGWFVETYSEAMLAKFGFTGRFVQDNHSMSAEVGTLRGIHFQAPPFAQDKLVRCLRGRIIDYAVDLRAGSPTYGKWVSAELTGENGHLLLIPAGFGHAFLTLEPDTEVAYKVTAPYSPECDGGVAWNDQTIGIDWPMPEAGLTLSDKDRRLPALADFKSPFVYEGGPLSDVKLESA
jgi:dTDP-4-dehydrorhamnose 3,5-epimerase